MKAIVLREFGGPEVLRYEDVPDPQPAPHEALVRVHAVTVNRSFDVGVRQNGNGRDVKLPLVMGIDPAGVVIAIGSEVQNLQVGDHVAARGAMPCGTCEGCKTGRSCARPQMLGVHRWGGDAEYVAVPATALRKLPPELPLADASAILRHFPTAFALARRAGLAAGETALVMGAAGALGQALIQVAKVGGTTVIAAAGSDERASFGLTLGADYWVNYRAQDLAAECRRLTDGRGVEVVFENIADPTLWPGAFDSLAREGRLATIGAHGGGTVPLNVRKLYNQHLSVLGGARSTREDEERSLQEALAGRIKAVIGATLPLAEASRGHQLVEEGKVIGKVVLVPPGA